MPRKAAAFTKLLAVPLRERFPVLVYQLLVGVSASLDSSALRTVQVPLALRPSVRNEQVLAQTKRLDAVVDVCPPSITGGRAHSQLRSRRVAGLGDFIGRCHFLHIYRVSKAWRSHPVSRRTKGLLGSACLAVANLACVYFIDAKCLSKTAAAAFKVSPL